MNTKGLTPIGDIVASILTKNEIAITTKVVEDVFYYLSNDTLETILEDLNTSIGFGRDEFIIALMDLAERIITEREDNNADDNDDREELNEIDPDILREEAEERRKLDKEFHQDDEH